MAGSIASRITGFGDYTVKSNTVSLGNAVPSFTNSAEGLRVCHREFITDIVGSGLFAGGRFALNPGLPEAFPWLSTVACSFEQYRFNGLVMEYRPSSGSFAGTNNSAALGIVVYATDYDVLAPPFTTKQMMESYMFSSSTVPFESMLHAVECAKGSNSMDTLLVRCPGEAPISSLQFYDLGNFQWGTQGMPADYTVGELWVTYDVTFKKPRINPYSLVSMSHIMCPSSVGTLPFQGATWTKIQGGDDLVIPVSTSAARMCFPRAGIYLISMELVCPDTNISAGLGFPFIGAHIVPPANSVLWQGGSHISPLPMNTQAHTTSHSVLTSVIEVIVDGLGNGNQIQVAWIQGSAPVSPNTLNVIVTRLSVNPSTDPVTAAITASA